MSKPLAQACLVLEGPTIFAPLNLVFASKASHSRVQLFTLLHYQLGNALSASLLAVQNFAPNSDFDIVGARPERSSEKDVSGGPSKVHGDHHWVTSDSSNGTFRTEPDAPGLLGASNPS